MNATTRRNFMGAAVALAAGALPAHAQGDYPNRTVRIVVGFAAGGGNDIFARLVGQKLADLGRYHSRAKRAAGGSALPLDAPWEPGGAPADSNAGGSQRPTSWM